MAVPGISVVLPVRNGAKYLNAAIASVASQTDCDFELLVIDDHSTDETPQIIRQWQARDLRICVMEAPREGIVAALNAGLRRARAPLVARMDADDIALPERFARQRAFLESHPDVIALGTGAEEIDANGVIRGQMAVPDGIEAVHAALSHRSPLLHPTVMMRRKPVQDIGGYRECCAYAEDYDLWLRIARIGKMANLSERLLQLRRHDGQVSQRKRLRQRAAAALARLLADPVAELPPSFEQKVPSPAELIAYLTRLGPRRLDYRTTRDIEVMLRSSAMETPLSAMDILAFRRVVASLGVWRSAATLAKIAAGR